MCCNMRVSALSITTKHLLNGRAFTFILVRVQRAGKNDKLVMNKKIKENESDPNNRTGPASHIYFLAAKRKLLTKTRKLLLPCNVVHSKYTKIHCFS